MYLRHSIRKKDGKTHCTWRLVRSVRIGKRVIQQTVAHLGELDEHGRIEARALARHVIGAPEQAQLFDDGCRDVAVPVRLKGIRIERSRQFGDVYLALALWRGVGLEELCERMLPVGKERIARSKMAAFFGGGAVVRAVERAAHCRGLVSSHGAVRSVLQLGDEEVWKPGVGPFLHEHAAHDPDRGRKGVPAGPGDRADLDGHPASVVRFFQKVSQLPAGSSTVNSACPHGRSTSGSTIVERVLVGGEDVDEAHAGTAVVVTLETETDVTRGDLLVAPPEGLAADHYPRPATAFAADLVWTGEEELRHGRSYLLLAGGLAVPAVVTAIRGRRDVVSGEEMAGRTLKMNDIGHVEIATDTAVPLDPYAVSRDTGGFLLVERVSRDTVAAGLVRHSLRRAHNVTPHAFTVDQEARAVLKGQRPRVLWLTGVPGAGKSTIADALERKLHGMGLHTYVLDGDGVRTGLNKDLGFTPEDRAENVRRVAETAKLMMDAGLIVIVSLVSPFRGDRRAAKGLFQEGDFLEVWVDTPSDVVVERDPKGLYAKARAGSLPNMTGVGQGYEPPEKPDLVVQGSGEVDDAVNQLLDALEVTH